MLERGYTEANVGTFFAPVCRYVEYAKRGGAQCLKDAPTFTESLAVIGDAVEDICT